MPASYFKTDIACHIWDLKYRYREGETFVDQTIEDTWRRIAKATARVEQDPNQWEKKFYGILEDFLFLPGGRVFAGAGTNREVTLFNCFVMGTIPDSMEGIFDALKEGAITMQQGGGVGYDFSTLRPRGMEAKTAGTIASGPVSFMKVWDAMCGTLLSTGVRRGAMMATLRCDHPDILEFVEAKRDRRELRHFNVSVLVTDRLLEAVKADADWPLVFQGQTRSVVRSRDLWDRIVRSAYDCAEPGVLFIDRINRQNNLWYREEIAATNPCGEIPLPPYGACNLGSFNLTALVRKPFSDKAQFDFDKLETAVSVATRMMDNVTDISRFPLKRQEEQAKGCRRLGLGVTGLGDALILMGLHYASHEGRELAAKIMKTICHAAYRTSVALAEEKGPFPSLETESYLEGEFIERLPAEIRTGIQEKGIRNSHLISIAPAGTISLLANNVSSGIEPVHAFKQLRNMIEKDGGFVSCELTDFAFELWRGHHLHDPLPGYFVEGPSLPPLAHLEMESALAPFVDNAISKTIAIPEDYEFEAFRSVFERAYELGLKGCTVFRPNPVTGELLKSAGSLETEPTCCPV